MLQIKSNRLLISYYKKKGPRFLRQFIHFHHHPARAQDASAEEDKTKAVGFFLEILGLFADVQEELSAPPSATA
ncbi:hypothetical protein Clacol_004920 [Clathrus columnatus]|uniref:Uncharacterized protein n=1 Tax=Clathrus columnatus TaxID=1419009 RepID=A0AAV5ADG6_9AGAM|nr:hypothetical protein Clacol_004920 [Clathrus columnatus]